MNDSTTATTPLDRGPRPLLELDHDLLVRTQLGLSREWLETDGRGGHAMGSAVDAPTRRHHGLLACVPDGSSECHLFLQRLDEQLCGDGRAFPLGMARYGAQFTPEKPLALISFELRPYPRWIYRFGLVELRRELLMVRGERTTLVRWTVSGPRSGLELSAKPLLPFRPAGGLTMENLQLDPTVVRSAGALQFAPYGGLPALSLTAAAAGAALDLGVRFEADPVWYRAISYLTCELRGEPATEEQFSPGWMHLPLEPDQPLTLACSIDGPVADPAGLWEREAERREAELRRAQAPGGAPPALELAAEHFLVRDAAGRRSVQPSYPWTSGASRATFLALPGLTLARGDLDGCRAVLAGALARQREGLFPSEFGQTPEADRFEPTDAGLWFALAADRYAAVQGADVEFVGGPLREGLERFAEALLAGRAPGLRVADCGLLAGGESGAGTSWMNAVVEDAAVTPRGGFAVEAAGLWFALLDQLAELADAAGQGAAAQRWAGLRDAAGAAFQEQLWREDLRFLADTAGPEGGSLDVRSNAVVAAALARSPLRAQQRADVVRRTELELRTHVGLRSLAPKNPAYEGHYRGAPRDRDRAQHQGSAWVWPLGFYVEAALAVDPRRGPELIELLGGLDEQLEQHGLGHVSELFDGDPPHCPGGAPAHAPAVAELLRAHALLRSRQEGGGTR